MISPVAVSRVGGVMIVAVGMLVRYGKRWLLKKMMDAMGRGRREKKHKKGNDPQGADGAEITKCCSHGVDNYLYPGFGQRILIKKAWPAQAQSAKLKLIIVGAKPPPRPFELNGKSGCSNAAAELYFFTAKLTSSLASSSVL